MENALEVLGISKQVVEYEKSTNSLDNLSKLIEKQFALLSRQYHPDVNPATADLYLRITEAVQELRSSPGLRFAVRWYVSEEDRASRLRSLDAARERKFDRDSMLAGFGLLGNINQFKVMNVDRRTSFMLQFGPGRAILNVLSHERTMLSLVSSDASEVLSVQPEKPEYISGAWFERYLDENGEEARYMHASNFVGPVTVVGFVPAKEFRARDSEGDVVHHDVSELGEGLAPMRIAPSWSAPETAWYLPKVVPGFSENASVVVRRSSGHLALVGTVQAQANL